MFTSVLKKISVEGGEKMKKLGLLVLLALVVALPALSENVNIVLNAGEEEWFCAPLIPFNPDPAAVFASYPLGMGGVSRIEATEGSQYATGDPGFGNILLGDGYATINVLDTTYICTYSGVPQSYLSDVWLSLPGVQSPYDELDAGGEHWIGCPFNSAVSFDTGVFVTDGTQTITYAQALQLPYGWVELMSVLEAGSQYGAGPSGFPVEDNCLRPGHMYALITHKDNISLIVLKPGGSGSPGFCSTPPPW
jgi:hypothetical protein